MTFVLRFGATIIPAIRGPRCPSGPVLMEHTCLPTRYNYFKEFELLVEKVNVTMNRRQFVRLKAAYRSQTQRIVYTDTIIRWRINIADKSTNTKPIPTATCNEVTIDKRMHE
ncbi:unnamed protein product [Toxocara canis]|uniref:Uncharacterized protein n=1 Tax=Toxocara canis TaxID=6265 RepID=A0A183U5J1_TOXCA|nr:unnamed protein product [Toxocara canis]